jgi:hypothetical protein
MITRKFKIFAIIILTLVFISTSFVSYYNLIYLPSQLVKNVNTNLDILNSNLREFENRFTELNKVYSQVSNLDNSNLGNTQEKLQKLKLEIEPINTLIDKTKSSQKEVKSGINNDTHEITDVINNNFTQRILTLETIIKIIDFDLCFNTNLIDFLYNHGRIPEVLRGLKAVDINNINDLNSISNYSQDLHSGLMLSLSKINDCLDKSDKSLFAIEEMKTQINKDQENFPKIKSTTDRLIRSLIDKNLNDSQILTAQLEKESEVSSLLNNAQYKKSLERSNLIIIDKYNLIRSEEEKVELKLNDIRKKYNLST